jgi:hypothetical protein
LDAAEDVKACLKPGRKTMGHLERFVQCVVRRKNAVNLLPFTIHRKIAVQFDHGLPDRDSLGAINLDFVAVLGARSEEDHARQQDHDNCLCWPCTTRASSAVMSKSLHGSRLFTKFGFPPPERIRNN